MVGECDDLFELSGLSLELSLDPRGDDGRDFGLARSSLPTLCLTHTETGITQFINVLKQLLNIS